MSNEGTATERQFDVTIAVRVYAAGELEAALMVDDLMEEAIANVPGIVYWWHDGTEEFFGMRAEGGIVP